MGLLLSHYRTKVEGINRDFSVNFRGIADVATKKHLKSLSQGKYAYAGEGDENDTLVIRDLGTADDYTVFGVKGVDNIYKVYVGIWDMIAAKKIAISSQHEKYVGARYYERGDSGNEYFERGNSVEMPIVGTNVHLTFYVNEKTFALVNVTKTNEWIAESFSPSRTL